MKQNDAEDPLDQQVNKADDTAQQFTASNVTQLENGGSAKVIEIQGGLQFTGRLYAMGIVPGTIIVKKTAGLMKGPIVIEKGEMQFAIGYGMAQRIMVEPIEKD